MASPLKFTVAFDEADGEGIVFFGNYFRLAHRAFEAFLPTIGIAWKDWFEAPEFGVPLRHVEADYLAPLKPGDDYEVWISVTDLGESSVHFEYEFKKGSTITAKLKTSHVFVSRPDMKKIAIPETIVRKLKSV
jgi:YbgC/YbaW family acyl-CoA thioester hydrolase